MPEKVYHILLLTNRDSENCGDQVIEACDISLLKAVLENLGVKKYKLQSRTASIITEKYIATREPALLATADSLIQKADLVVFGGAPLFSYLRQTFYERTAVTLELCEKYHKPAIFSAIGIEQYDENDERCQRLKKTLGFSCVKQITTRDGLSFLMQFCGDNGIPLARVADPAVFSDLVMEKFISAAARPKKKKIGIFVIRANAFLDNGYPFSAEQAVKMWLSLTQEFEKKGYDWEFLTSGSYADEAFLDTLIREYNVDEKRCRFGLITPEMFVSMLSGYDAVISCRLHPGIVAYSLKVPAIGLVWNNKVSAFYENTGYPQRSVPVEQIDPADLVRRTEQAIAEGVEENQEYRMTVYRTLFNGVSAALEISPAEPVWDYDVLRRRLPRFDGTSEKEKAEKTTRKLRRIYKAYNAFARSSRQLKSQNWALRRENESRHPLAYKILRNAKKIMKKLMKKLLQ